jgi:DNA polymerase III subunit alpha
MMFATLDDVEGQVEMLVFKADQAESAAVIAPDAVVLVRGRIDHKERGETKLVVQEAESFEPDSEELARVAAIASSPAEPLRLTIDAAMLRSPGLLDQLKEVLEHHKGEAKVHLAIRNGEGGQKELELGDEYRVRPSSGLRAELGHVLGTDALAA